MLKKILMSLIFFTNVVFAAQDNFSIDLQNVSMVDALHILGKLLNKNIIISPHVTGVASLHLHDMPQQEAFDLLLVSHYLSKRKIGNTWFIAPQAELVQHQQEELKLQTAWEDVTPLATRVWQINYAKAEDIARLIQDNANSLLSKRGHVRVDSRTNILCVQDTAEHLQEIQNVVKRLDIPVQQVLIETRLASIDYDFERELGLNFAVQYPSDNAEPQHLLHAPKRYSLAIAKLADGSILDAQLSALENEGHGELISSPSLFTSNQQTALIESGEEIPYQEVSESGGTAVAFKKAVLRLKVTPQIMPGDKVLLQLQINQDKPSNRMVQGVPAINTRQISTNVLVGNAQTIVLGGIYESNHEQGEQRIPFLGKIPLVGWLFKQQNVLQNKRELLIFVTPKIIPQSWESHGKSETQKYFSDRPHGSR